MPIASFLAQKKMDEYKCNETNVEWVNLFKILFLFRTWKNYKIQNVFFLQFWSVAKSIGFRYFPLSIINIFGEVNRFLFCRSFIFFMPVSLFIGLMISVAVVQFLFSCSFHRTFTRHNTMHLWLRWTIIQNVLLVFHFIFYFSFQCVRFPFLGLSWPRPHFFRLFYYFGSVSRSTRPTSMPHKYFVLSLFSTLRFESM